MEYKRVPGYKAEISADGRSIRSLITGKELKISRKSTGLMIVSLSTDDGRRTRLSVISLYRKAWNFELPFRSGVI